MQHALFLLLSKQCNFTPGTILMRNTFIWNVIQVTLVKTKMPNLLSLKYVWYMLEIWSQIRALAEAGYLVLAAVKSLHIQFFRPKNCYKLLQNSVKLSPDICTWATTNIGKHFKESFSTIDAIHCHCSAIAIQYNAVPFGSGLVKIQNTD